LNLRLVDEPAPKLTGFEGVARQRRFLQSRNPVLTS
jgi:hypothetical protein